MSELPSRSSTPPNETHEASDNDNNNDADGDSDSGIGNFSGMSFMALHSQLQQQLQQQQEQLLQQQGDAHGDSEPPQTLELPLTPMALYPPQPRDETEARESFRRGAIDKAHEISALSWVEHIQNHDINRFRNSIKRRPRSQSTTETTSTSLRRSASPLNVSEHEPIPEAAEGIVLVRSARSFHSVSARSTLRRRRSSSYGDLDSSFSATVPARPDIALRDKSPTHEEEDNSKGDIEIVAAPTLAETEIPDRELSEAASPRDTSATEGKGISAPTEPFSRRKSIIEGLATWEKYWNRKVQLMVSLALFSYLGQFTRYFIEHLFGKACHFPETVGWVHPDWSSCTSSPGTTDSTGGAFFTDLPTNLIGCFVMGLLVSGDGESISVNLPMAALPRNHFFQNWVVTHVGLRTGFCGALTTFASWNTQMVIMICGGRKATALVHSQWTSAIWGYLVGFYASLQSYQFGVAVAFCLSRWYNPHLAKEADRIVDKKAIGVLIHRDLPDFERRFLHAIILEGHHKDDEGTGDPTRENLRKYGENCYESFYDDHIHHLKAWKETTDDHRNGFKGVFEDSTKSYVSELHEIEKNLLVNRIEPRQELLEIARDAGWDVEALKNWTLALSKEEEFIERVAGGSGRNFTKNDNTNSGENDSNRFSSCEEEDSIAETHLEDAYFTSSYSSVAEVGITLVCFLAVTGLLITGFFHYSDQLEANATEINEPTQIDPVIASSYRTQFLSSLLAPLGTYCRWYMSRLNGSLKTEKWEWLPIGTLLANVIASLISAFCAGVSLGLDSEEHSLLFAFVKAVQVGFAGSFSTVSTFCTETTGLLRALPRAFWGYYYGFGSMASALAVGFVGYVWAVL